MAEPKTTLLDEDLDSRHGVREIAKLRGIQRDRVQAALFDAPAGPRMLGRFQILGRLGRGGMGTVLEAYDETLDRKVAVKHLHEDSAGHHRQRLLREAQALARLSHPNVVQVYDAGEHEERLFIAMELVPGQTLWDWQRTPHPWMECLDVYLQAGRGLAAAHAVGIVHRDFKPPNCIIDERGCCKVLDFGLARGVDELEDPELERHARSVDPSEHDDSESTHISGASISAFSLELTRTGAKLGTPAYMAPEQALGRPADARSDQFSFCVSLYEALFGERPFDGTSGLTLLVVGDEPTFEPVESHASLPRVPSWLRAVIARGLSPKKDDRFESMEALLGEIEARRGRRRRRAIAGGVLGVALVGVIGGWAGLRQQPCDGWHEASMPSWTADARGRVEASLTAASEPDGARAWESVRRALDDYAVRWVETRADACEATRVEGRGTEASLELQLSCLDRRDRQMDAVVGLLADADARTVAHAAQAVRSLPSVEPCTDVELLQGGRSQPDPQQEAEIRASIAESWAAGVMGRGSQALPRADRAVADAGALGEAGAGLEAKARLNRARLYRSALRLADARDDLEAVVERAEQDGDLVLATDALIELVMVVSDDRDLGALEAWMTVARGKLRRLSDRSRYEAALHHLEGVLARRQGDAERAAESLRAAAEAYRRLGPEGALERGRVLAMLAETWWEQGRDEPAADALDEALELAEAEGLVRLEENIQVARGHFHEHRGELELAEAALRRSLALTERLDGPGSPSTIPAAALLAEILERRGDLDGARELLVGARDALGPRVPALRHAEVFGQIARFERERGDIDAALEAYRSARTAWESMPEPDPVELAMLDTNVADCTMLKGELTMARAGYERALAALVGRTAPDDERLLFPHLGLGHVLLALGEAERAVPHLRRAEELRAAMPDDPWLSALVGSELGMAVLRSQTSTPARDAEAVRALEAAIDFYREQEQETTELEAFLESCGPRCSSPNPSRTPAEPPAEPPAEGVAP